MRARYNANMSKEQQEFRPEPEKKEKKRKPRAGVIPVRRNKHGELEVLMVTPENGETYKDGSPKYVFPKGKIDKGRTAEEMMHEEALEEAGIHGELDPNWEATYYHSERKPEVKMRVMWVDQMDNEWQEQGDRERLWVSLDEARSLLRKEGLINTFDEAVEYLKSAEEETKAA